MSSGARGRASQLEQQLKAAAAFLDLKTKLRGDRDRESGEVSQARIAAAAAAKQANSAGFQQTKDESAQLDDERPRLSVAAAAAAARKENQINILSLSLSLSRFPAKRSRHGKTTTAAAAAAAAAAIIGTK